MPSDSARTVYALPAPLVLPVPLIYSNIHLRGDQWCSWMSRRQYLFLGHQLERLPPWSAKAFGPVLRCSRAECVSFQSLTGQANDGSNHRASSPHVVAHVLHVLPSPCCRSLQVVHPHQQHQVLARLNMSCEPIVSCFWSRVDRSLIRPCLSLSVCASVFFCVCVCQHLMFSFFQFGFQ